MCVGGGNMLFEDSSFSPRSQQCSCRWKPILHLSGKSLLSLTVVASGKLCIVNPVVGRSLGAKIAHTKKV